MGGSSLLKRGLRSVGISRSRVAAARMLAERLALSVARRGRPRNRSEGRILCYHSVGQPEYGVNDVSPARFRRQLELALRQGYRFVPADVIARGGGEARDLAVTFDDATSSCGTHAAEILADYSIPWTVFVVAGWTERAAGNGSIMSWTEIARLKDQGVAIGSHSVTHPDFSSIGAEQVETELVRSRTMIHERIGILPDAFAIPYGQSMNWTADCHAAATRAGYAHIYAQAQNTRPQRTVGRSFVTCFDGEAVFSALLRGAYDDWEEWF